MTAIRRWVWHHAQNLRLDVVMNDITGLTSLKIIQAICHGVTDGKS